MQAPPLTRTLELDYRVASRASVGDAEALRRRAIKKAIAAVIRPAANAPPATGQEIAGVPTVTDPGMFVLFAGLGSTHVKPLAPPGVKLTVNPFSTELAGTDASIVTGTSKTTLFAGLVPVPKNWTPEHVSTVLPFCKVHPADAVSAVKPLAGSVLWKFSGRENVAPAGAVNVNGATIAFDSKVSGRDSSRSRPWCRCHQVQWWARK